MDKNTQKQYILGGSLTVFGILTYFLIQNSGKLLLGDNLFGVLLNVGLTPFALLIGGYFIIMGIIAIVKDIESVFSYLIGTFMLAMTVIYIIFPDFLPGPIDDVVVGAIGAFMSSLFLRSSSK